MIHRYRTLLSLLAMLSATALSAQTTDNMVHNPSFESHGKCPERIEAMGIMTEVDAWWQPTAGSSDYFNACGERESGIPRNKMGFQAAHSGGAYCGIYCSQENYREYLQTELKSPLVAGKKYRLTFYVSLADKSPQAIATIGALLSQERLSDTTYNILMKREVVDYGNMNRQSIAVHYSPQVENVDTAISDSKTWTRISGEFIAEGGERFLTIGNFRPFNDSHVIHSDNRNGALQGAYYYIDDVELICLDCADNEPKTQEKTDTAAPEIGEIIPMWNIFFPTGKSDILPQSYNELQSILNLLRSHPTMKIELRGHTDNQGSLEFNQRLSEARAKAVMDYLVSHGIDQQRLISCGFGKTLPVDTNDTPEGRQRNRRVEYKILSK